MKISSDTSVSPSSTTVSGGPSIVPPWRTQRRKAVGSHATLTSTGFLGPRGWGGKCFVFFKIHPFELTAHSHRQDGGFDKVCVPAKETVALHFSVIEQKLCCVHIFLLTYNRNQTNCELPWSPEWEKKRKKKKLWRCVFHRKLKLLVCFLFQKKSAVEQQLTLICCAHLILQKKNLQISLKRPLWNLCCKVQGRFVTCKIISIHVYGRHLWPSHGEWINVFADNNKPRE